MSFLPAFKRPEFLKSRGIPVWVVVTGNVRSGREFKGIFSKVLSLRESGLIDGIRFVTWHGEIESIEGLEQALVSSGISILTIEEPKANPKTHPLFHGFVYHQRKALHFALESLPKDAFVLKARTDMAEERFDSMVNAIFSSSSPDLEVGILDPILKTRLFTYDARPDYLFYWDDIVFSGLRDDLIRLNNFDQSCEFIYPGHISAAECRLFAPLFLDHYPILRWFFENIDGMQFSKLIQLWILYDKEVPLPSLIRNILASYLHVLSRYVLLPNIRSRSTSTIGLKSFFIPNEDLGVRQFLLPWCSHKLCDQTLLDNLLVNEFFDGIELGEVDSLIRLMDSDVLVRGAMPIEMEESMHELATFANDFSIQIFTPQTRLTIAKPIFQPFTRSLLDAIELPEKRELSWWRRKTTGVRRRVAEYVIRKLL